MHIFALLFSFTINISVYVCNSLFHWLDQRVYASENLFDDVTIYFAIKGINIGALNRTETSFGR